MLPAGYERSCIQMHANRCGACEKESPYAFETNAVAANSPRDNAGACMVAAGFRDELGDK